MIKNKMGILAVVLFCLSNSMSGMTKEEAKKDRSQEALWKLGKCFAVWGATGVAVGGVYWLNKKAGNVNGMDGGFFSPETMNNFAFATSLSGLLAGIDVVADKDVKSVTEQTILRVPVIMATQKILSSKFVHNALRNYSPVLKDVLVCKDSSAHDKHECALKAATLGTLLYVTAIRPALDISWKYGKTKIWEAKNWVTEQFEQTKV